MEILYRHIIYQNFQKKIFYDMNIFLALNKIHTKSDNSKSATGLLKTNKNHFKNSKMISNKFCSNFLLQGIMLPYFLYILFFEKNNLNKTQITPILKNNCNRTLNKSFETPNSYFLCFEEVILSSLVKIIELHKVSELENIFK